MVETIAVNPRAPKTDRHMNTKIPNRTLTEAPHNAYQ